MNKDLIPNSKFDIIIIEFEFIFILKLTQYLTNIYEMRFLMKNCLKYTLHCQNGKHIEQQRNPNQYYGSSITTSWYGESPIYLKLNYTLTDTHCTIINLKSSKIKENVSLKLVSPLKIDVSTQADLEVRFQDSSLIRIKIENGLPTLKYFIFGC